MFLLVYSLLFYPIYLVGRADIVGQCGYLGLAGSGIARLESLFAGGRRWISREVALAMVGFLSVATLAPVYRSSGPWSTHTDLYASQADFLKLHARPDDVIVCFWSAGAAMLYEKRMRGISGDVVTFPNSLMDHLGWLNPEDTITKESSALAEEARRLISACRGTGGQYRRIWLVLDSATYLSLRMQEPRPYLAQIAEIFFREGARRHMRKPPLSPEVIDDMGRLGMGLFVPPDESEDEAR